MFDIMQKMMPLMIPFFWIAVGVAVAGFLLLGVKIIFEEKIDRVVAWASYVVIGFAVFFITAQVAGYFLGASPSINFRDSTKFEFLQIFFWQLSLILFFPAMLLLFLNKGKANVEK